MCSVKNLEFFVAHDARPRDLVAFVLLLCGLGPLGALVTSSLVLVMVMQVWHDYPWPFYQRLGVFLARDYLASTPDFRPWGAWPAGLGFASTAALLLEGIALLVVTGMLVRRRPDARRPARENACGGCRGSRPAEPVRLRRRIWSGARHSKASRTHSSTQAGRATSERSTSHERRDNDARHAHSSPRCAGCAWHRR